jgi:L-ascorbate metabolism protein UlaG (beta-lactamase superfamily)
VELQYYGANCVRITTKGASIVVDDNLSKLGLKSITKPTDISLRTSNLIPSDGAQFSADMPGEYEVADVVVHGVAARGHMDEEGGLSATIFTIAANDLKIAIIGHVYPELSEDQLEQIGLVDVVVMPIGGNGYTLDSTGALQIIKKIEPKVVIPTHYADKSIRYEVPQAELADALKNLGMEPNEILDKYKPKAGEISDTTNLIVLNRQ